MARFEVGQKYSWTSWFTGGVMLCTVIARTETVISFKCIDNEIDGVDVRMEDFEVISDDNGNECILFCEYKGHKGYIHALTECSIEDCVQD